MTGSSQGKHDVSTNEAADPEGQQPAPPGNHDPPPGGDLGVLMAATVCAAGFRQRQTIEQRDCECHNGQIEKRI